jgi:hypothetical protein
VRLPSRIGLGLLAAALTLVIDPVATWQSGTPAIAAAQAKRHPHKRKPKHVRRRKKRRRHKAPPPATEM